MASIMKMSNVLTEKHELSMNFQFQMKEYDIVRINRQINNVPKGSIGTILIVYEGENDFEVEFVNDAGETLNVLTLGIKDLD